jgi:hypothetical protein
MKKIFPFAMLFLFGCNQHNNKENVTPNTPTQDSTKLLQSSTGKAINLIDGYQVTDTVNDYVLFPLQVKDAKEQESAALFSKSRGGEGGLFWNVIFYNYKTNQSTLLEPTNKILIGGYNFWGYSSSYSGYNNTEGNTVGHLETNKQTPYIFYSVYKDDYNNDKKLNTDDPAYFFVSNKDGSNFKQVSPSNISITNKTFPKNNSFLLLEGLRDSNNDKKFDADDEKVFYKVNMTDSALVPQEIFNATFKVELKKLFNKHWIN